MIYNRYYLPILVGLFLLITVCVSSALAGDPLEVDEDFLFGDPDNDDLFTWEELWMGTDPYNSDSDFDGIPDRWEFDNLMNPADASDAHEDMDYDPALNISVGEREANFDAVKKDIDVWPSNRAITTIEPVFDEDGPHYDNYEEYYRPYHDQKDNMKVKIMKTKPDRPDSDGDGKLDPDDYEPYNFKNDGVGMGGADAPKEAIEVNDDSNLNDQDNNDESMIALKLPNNFANAEAFDFEIATPIATPATPTGNKDFLIDVDNDGF
jgi:hypothetical protein